MGTKANRSADAAVVLDDRHNHSLKSRAAAVSIASNTTLIVFKLVVGLMSGSIAIISEALHSGSDLVAALIAFWSVRQAAQPPDERHHYGHEKVENLSGVIEALLIIAAAGVIIYEGVMKLFHGPELDHIWLGIGVMVVSGCVNLIVSRKVLYPVARRTDSAALEADAAHLLTDVYTSFGVAFGLLLVKLTGWPYFDPIAAIAVAVLIIKTGYDLVMQSTRVLLDETLPDDELEEIRRCVREHRGDIISGYHKLRARRAGSRRHVDLHVVVDADLTVTEAHDIAEHIEDDIRACIPNTDVLVHVEPRSPDRFEED
ncbi:MAG: cation diffusion facilitator family transporter [Deltaproteobacteria bacterium]